MGKPPTPATSPSSRNARARDLLPGGGRAVGAAAGHPYRWRGQRRQPHAVHAARRTHRPRRALRYRRNPPGDQRADNFGDGIRAGRLVPRAIAARSRRSASKHGLPAGAPLGDVSLTVTVNGVPSAPYALKVVRAGFGIFSRNQEGWGPGRVDNQACRWFPFRQRRAPFRAARPAAGSLGNRAGRIAPRRSGSASTARPWSRCGAGRRVKPTRLCFDFRRTARPAVTFRFRFDSRTLPRAIRSRCRSMPAADLASLRPSCQSRHGPAVPRAWS